MVISTKLAAAVLGGVLLVAAYTPAFAGSASDVSAAAPAAVAPSSNQSLMGVLSPFLTDATPHQAQKNCKADSLYSQHSVVGDPDSCFQGRVDIRNMTAGSGFGGVL